MRALMEGAGQEGPVLVIACGDKKIGGRGPHRVRDIYKGPLWSSYRKWRRDHGYGDDEDLPIPVYVLSAKHLLMPDSERIPHYDKKLTASELPRYIPALRQSLRKHGVEGRDIVYAGPRPLYLEALEATGSNVTRLSGKGWGGMRKELKAWLDREVGNG